MERLKQTSKLFLGDAEKDLLNQKYATCVIHLHMAAEHTLKAHLLKFGEEIEFKTLLEAAKRLYILGAINKSELKAFSKMNTLRNRIYHGAYLPSGYETSAIFHSIKKVVTKLLNKL